MKEKVCLYQRYSSDNQSENSIEYQRKFNTEFCKSKGYDIVMEYNDEAVTGQKENREEFQKMFAEASKTGSIEKRKDRKCAWILADFVAQFFSGKGLTLNKDVKKELYNRGYIERFGDKYQKYHTISNLDAPCICFFIDKQPSNDKEPDKKPVVKKTTSNLAKANSKINLLLSEDEDAC